MKHIFIVNPVAGTGSAEEKLLPPIREFVKTHEFDYEIHRSLNKAEIGSYCRQRASVGDEVRFYACGGDGTINDVANGIVGFPNAQLAVIPCGSGNDFVKNFSDRKNFLNIEKQANGTVINVDIIQMTSGDGEVSYALNMLNIGTDCDIVVESQEMKRLPFVAGAGAYALAAIKIVPQNRLYRMRYEKDGQDFEEDVMLCAVANGQWCGGGFHNCPKASLDDGLMDVAIVYSCTGPVLPKMLLKYRKGTHLEDKHADKYIKYFQVPKFKLAPVQDVNVSIDGECAIFKETVFEILPKALKFVVPEGCSMIEGK